MFSSKMAGESLKKLDPESANGTVSESPNNTVPECSNSLARTISLRHRPQNYKCQQCSFKTNSTVKLTEHQKLQHKRGERVYQCEKCNFKTSKYYLPLHQKHCQEDKKEIFNCKDCSFTTYYKNHLAKHRKRCHSVKVQQGIYSCEKCNFKADYKLLIVRHERQSHSVRKPIYKCDRCNFKTDNKYYLPDHQIRKHGEHSKILIINNSNIKSQELLTGNATTQSPAGNELNSSIETNADVSRNLRSSPDSPVGILTCDVCQNFKTEYRQALARHKECQHGISNPNRRYACPECDYIFGRKIFLSRHCFTTHGFHYYCCELCSFGTKSKDYLPRHYKLLHGFKCDKCRFTTVCKNKLQEHAREPCPSKYKRSTLSPDIVTRAVPCLSGSQINSVEANNSVGDADLDKERPMSVKVQKSGRNENKKNQRSKSLDCKLCNYSTNRRSHFVRHLNSMHSSKYFKCSHCTFKTKHEGYLPNHFQRVHGSEKYISRFQKTKSHLRVRQQPRRHQEDEPSTTNLKDKINQNVRRNQKNRKITISKNYFLRSANAESKKKINFTKSIESKQPEKSEKQKEQPVLLQSTAFASGESNGMLNDDQEVRNLNSEDVSFTVKCQNYLKLLRERKQDPSKQKSFVNSNRNFWNFSREKIKSKKLRNYKYAKNRQHRSNLRSEIISKMASPTTRDIVKSPLVDFQTPSESLNFPKSLNPGDCWISYHCRHCNSVTDSSAWLAFHNQNVHGLPVVLIEMPDVPKANSKENIFERPDTLVATECRNSTDFAQVKKFNFLKLKNTSKNIYARRNKRAVRKQNNNTSKTDHTLEKTRKYAKKTFVRQTRELLGSISENLGRNLSRSANHLEINLDNLDKNSGNLERSSGNLDKNSDNLRKSSGNVDKNSGNLESNSYDLGRNEVNLDNYSNLKRNSDNVENISENFDSTLYNLESNSNNLECKPKISFPEIVTNSPVRSYSSLDDELNDELIGCNNCRWNAGSNEYCIQCMNTNPDEANDPFQNPLLCLDISDTEANNETMSPPDVEIKLLMSAFQKQHETCPECRAPVTDIVNRLAQDLCGHFRCRNCFKNNADCLQCAQT